MIVDEAAHASEELIFKTIIPILSMKKTALMCLSSPGDEENHYSKMLTLKKEDDPTVNFFRVLECAKICKACRKLERVRQIACNHIRSSEHWLSDRKIRELRPLYKLRPEDAIREFGGLVISNNLPAFRKEEIARMFAAAPYDTLAPPPFVFTCCDPSGGGPSMLSVVSGYYTGVDTVVVKTLAFLPPSRLAGVLFLLSCSHCCASLFLVVHLLYLLK